MSEKREPTHRLQRTTEALTGTALKTQAALSFPAAFALEYAQVWLARAGSRRVPSAGVIRRALAVYVEHLHHQSQQEATGPALEVRAVNRACNAFQVSPEDQQMAQLRLHTAPVGEPLPDLQTLLSGPCRLAEMQAMEERADTYCQSILQSQTFKMTAGRKAKRAARAAALTHATTGPTT